MSAAQIDAATELIAILTEGAAYRRELTTAAEANKPAMAAIYRDLFQLLFDKK
ncbi:Uncharacterised protein [Raoultella terrigena]|nr:Uncharacterised protein [Raoultella terrigena]